MSRTQTEARRALWLAIGFALGTFAMLACC
jgi:hypothetical protein